MDKQKQIEEMAQCKNAYGFVCCDCVYRKSCERYSLAEDLYDLGYRKIPENAVVLTREELKEKIDCCDVSMIHHDDDGKRYIEYEKYEDFTDRLGKRIQQLKGQLKQARKETAEKFAKGSKQRLRDKLHRGKALHTTVFGKEYVRRIFKEVIDEICEELTEGKV